MELKLNSQLFCADLLQKMWDVYLTWSLQIKTQCICKRLDVTFPQLMGKRQVSLNVILQGSSPRNTKYTAFIEFCLFNLNKKYRGSNKE